MNLPLPTKVPKLPCISGVPRPCGFPLLLLGTHASPQLFPTLKLPLSIPRARPPSPSLAWGAGGWCPRGAHRLLPSPTLRRSSSRPGRGAALRARRAPGPFAGAAGRGPAHGQSTVAAVGTAPSGGGLPAWLPGGTLSRGHGRGVSVVLTERVGTRLRGREAARAAAERWLHDKP